MARPVEYHEQRIATSVRLLPDLYERLHAEAAKRDVSVNWLMVKATTYYLDNVLQPLP